MRTCGSILITALLAGHLAQSVWAQCARYQVQTIPGPDCQFLWSYSGATGISESGEICGVYGDCNEGGFGAVWLGQGGWIALPVQSPLLGFSPWDINSSRQMAGTTAENSTYTRAAFYDFTTSTLMNLGVFPGDNNSAGHAINDRGVVCGYSYSSLTGPLRAFVWQDGQMSALNLPLGPHSFANDIAENDAICGWMGPTPENGGHAFVWLNGRTTDLGVVLIGALGAEAYGISSDATSTCGAAIFTDPVATYTWRAFVWHEGVGVSLGVLPGIGHDRSAAYAVNDSAIAVGKSSNANNVGDAFVWRNGVMSTLNDLIPAGLNLDITDVSSINNAGQIAGEARVLNANGTPTGDRVAVRLTPIQSPPGDCDCNGRIDMDDILGVINQWGPAVPTTTADFNDDGIVSVDDLMEVIRGWTF